MEKLTLKEIAGYSDYNLQFQVGTKSANNIRKYVMEGFCKSKGNISIKSSGNTHIELIENIKPILYPLEMLTKPIVHNGVEIIPLVKHVESFGEPCDDFDENNLTDYQYAVLEMLSNRDMRHQDDLEFLQEHHFDYQDLIKSGKAIDKSKLKP